MSKFYTAEKNTQMLIALMKAHGVKKVVASPGATNVCFVGSIQQDSFFEIYSVVDERSAAYLACGLAAESGEPVALTCTGATASRNYLPGLTEAYYRQLPILAVTSTQETGRVSNYVPQVIDRSTIQNDVARFAVDIPAIRSEEDEWACNVKLNKALLELKRSGGGPVHINLTTTYNDDFSVKSLPEYRIIDRITSTNQFPKIMAKRVAVFVGTHSKWSDKLTNLVDNFCRKYNGVVFCDRVANYYGKYRVNPCLVGGQLQYKSELLSCDLMIHIGNVSGTDNHMGVEPSSVWRVNPDGEVRDTFRKLQYVFEMTEEVFFENYVPEEMKAKQCEYHDAWYAESKRITEKVPELPFSNAWIANNTLEKIPEGSILHFAILNSLRSWNYFECKKNFLGYANTGGFGIDGCVSSLIGAALCNRKVLHYGVVGDLAFFYDMNAIGNRHIGSNVRLLIINNGKGQEFRNSLHFASNFGEDADAYMAAAGHFGNKSRNLIRHCAEDLGHLYLCADSKESFIKQLPKFTEAKIGTAPIIFEVFTDSKDESDAFDIMHNLETTTQGKAKQLLKGVIGEEGLRVVKKMIGR